MNLLVFNLIMDADHPVLGHTTPMVNALARRSDHVTVITMATGRVNVDENVSVHSLGKEREWSEPRRLAEFFRLTRGTLRERRIDACFAHMAPLFTILFSPQARRRRIPILLWFAHTNVTRTLRLAHAMADRCVTSTPEGFQIDSEKLFILGQGIDTERFRPPLERSPLDERTVISVGRISPIKRIDEMVNAIALLRERGHEAHLRLFGAPHTEDDRRHEAILRTMARRAALNGQISFEGPVPFHEVASAYHRGGIFLNLSETGSIDKAILESMASGCIPVSRNAAFRAIARERGLEWLVPGEGPASVADRIEDVVNRPRAERVELVGRLRKIVATEHSLERLSDGIVGQLRELVEMGGRSSG